MGIPRELVAGDSVTWFNAASTDNLGRELAPPDWTLKTSIRGSSSVDVTAVADGGKFKSELTAAQTTSLTPGVYFWQARVENGADKITIATGQLTVKPNIAAATGTFDGRSQARKDLEALQAAIRAMVAGGAVQSYSIAGRSLQKMSMADLIQLENKLKYDVMQEERAERVASGLGDPTSVRVRFK